MCVHVSVVNYRVVKIGRIKQMRQYTELSAVRLRNCVKGLVKHPDIEDMPSSKKNMPLTLLKVYMNTSENAPRV